MARYEGATNNHVRLKGEVKVGFDKKYKISRGAGEGLVIYHVYLFSYLNLKKKQVYLKKYLIVRFCLGTKNTLDVWSGVGVNFKFYHGSPRGG